MNTKLIIEKMELMMHNLPMSEEGKQKLARIKQLEKTNREISELEAWFQAYDRSVMEHNRCERMGTICMHNIIALDIEANEKQIALKTLRAIKNGQ